MSQVHTLLSCISTFLPYGICPLFWKSHCTFIHADYLKQTDAFDEEGYHLNHEHIIRSDRSHCDVCFRKMLLTWLDSSPSWEDLATALEQNSVGCTDMAEEIRRNYGLPEKTSLSCEDNYA